MSDFTIQELVILKVAMLDRIESTKKLAAKLGDGDNLACILSLEDYRRLLCKIVETLERRTNRVYPKK